MRIPVEWLSEFITYDLSVAELAHALTMAGLEVEAIEPVEGDHVLEVNITPNRGDCLSIIGIAREVAALTGARLKMPEHGVFEEQDFGLGVSIRDEDLCSRYAGRVIKNISMGESPQWLKKRLEKCGLRAINIVVDITNYVLLELGHPLHAFDLGKLKGGISVSRAGKGQCMTTLDGVKRELPEESLLIWDAQNPVAVAGVMGGKDTEVGTGTKDIFLESAWFQPSPIRRTSKSLGLGSESSYRFERGADIEMLETALDRAAYLIKKLAGGEIGKKTDAYPRKHSSRMVKVAVSRINRLLGADISVSEVEDIFKRLSFKVIKEGDLFSVTPPSYRLDVEREADLVEEVARIWGYGKIPVSRPRADIASGEPSGALAFSTRLKEAARMAGMHEAINFSFMNPSMLDVLSIPEGDERRDAVRLRNPLRHEESLLRTTLVPSLLENFRHNFFRGVRDISLFELSRVFISKGGIQPIEPMRLAGLIFADNKAPSLYKEQTPEFYLAKGSVEFMLSELKVPPASFSPSGEPFLHPGRSARVEIRGETIGFVGAVSPQTLEALGVKVREGVAVFELDCNALMRLAPKTAVFEQLPKYPFVERDIAIVVEDSITSDAIRNLITAYPSEFIEDTWVFDSYKGQGVPEGKKSLAFGIRYRAKDRTLTDDEVEAIHSGLVAHLELKTGGTIRK